MDTKCPKSTEEVELKLEGFSLKNMIIFLSICKFDRMLIQKLKSLSQKLILFLHNNAP